MENVCTLTKRQDTRHAQIRSIASAEPIGSVLFYTHLGLLLFAAVTAQVLFGHAEFLVAYAIYAGLLTVEKSRAKRAADAADLSAYPTILTLLFLRSIAFNIIVLLVWRLEGDVFKMAALALLVSATINIMVFHATYRAVMASVVVPISMCFATIAVVIILQEGWSPAAMGAVAVFMCVTPYFVLALVAAQKRWHELNRTKVALEQAQRMDAIGRVASGVSHDFNNTLSVIAGNLHLLETETDPLERMALLRSANAAVEGGASLSRQLLTMGKKQTLLPQAVTLEAVIDSFVVFCRNVFPASIAIDVRHRRSCPTVFVDPNLLQSALLNLALNAKAAMPEGGTLVIDYGVDQVRSNPVTHGFVSLTDSGVGMSEEVMAQSFDPFFSTRSTEGGSGLGLPMVKGFIEQSNGRITLESTQGHGTTVTLFLPLAQEEMQSPRLVRSTRAADVARDVFTRVLLVEDNSEMRKILRTFLKRCGYDVVSFESGDEAARFLTKGSSVHLILCDFDLPGEMQGDDLLSLVRTAQKKTPFILMSGFAPTEKTADTERLAKADLFLSKPLQLTQLRAQIEGLLAAA